MKERILRLAKKHQWDFLEEQPGIGLISFSKIFGGHPARINVYTTKMTVGTAIHHPKQGKTQMFRRDVSLELLDKLFENPRQHTGKGYRQRK